MQPAQPVDPVLEEPPMFRFTIRDVLWLTVLVGLALGWWIDHANSRHKAVERDSEWFECFLNALSKGNSGEPFSITTPTGKSFQRIEYSPNRPIRNSESRTTNDGNT
jgi:hypothetical protein